MNTKENLRACITALLADEERGCSKEHLDNLLEECANALNQQEITRNFKHGSCPTCGCFVHNPD